MVNRIFFNGLDDNDKKWIIKRCNLMENSLNSIEAIEKATSIIRANTNYSSITYKLKHHADDSYDLH